jgi:hypothetical protein
MTVSIHWVGVRPTSSKSVVIVPSAKVCRSRTWLSRVSRLAQTNATIRLPSAVWLGVRS